MYFNVYYRMFSLHPFLRTRSLSKSTSSFAISRKSQATWRRSLRCGLFGESAALLLPPLLLFFAGSSLMSPVKISSGYLPVDSSNVLVWRSSSSGRSGSCRFCWIVVRRTKQKVLLSAQMAGAAGNRQARRAAKKNKKKGRGGGGGFG